MPLFEKVGESKMLLKCMRPSSGNHAEEDEGKGEKKKYGTEHVGFSWSSASSKSTIYRWRIPYRSQHDLLTIAKINIYYPKKVQICFVFFENRIKTLFAFSTVIYFDSPNI